MHDRGDTGDFHIVWRCLFDRPDRKESQRCRKGCDGTCRSDQWPESERSFGRISERTYGSRWHYINKAITDQESKRTWDVYDPQIFSVGFHGI